MLKLNKYKMRNILLLLIILISYTSISQSSNKMIDYVLAQVGGAIILKSDFENAIMQMEAQGYSIDEKTKCDIFEDLISKKILLHQAKLDSITVSNERIKQEIDYRINYFMQKLGSRKNMEDYFNKDIEQIKISMTNSLKEQLVTQEMQKELTKDISVSMPEIKQLFSLMSEETLPIVPEKYKFAQIVRKIKPSEESINKLKENLTKFRKQIINNEASFSGIAAMYSECPSSKKGGELGYTNRTALDPEFAAVAFRLKKDEVSRIVKSSFGYHIIKLIDRKGDRINVKHILLTPKISNIQIKNQSKILDSIIMNINNNKISFADAALYYSFDEETKANGGLAINKNDGSLYFKKVDLSDEAKKNIPLLTVNSISKPFVYENDKKQKTIKIVKLIEKIKAHKLNYKDDYQAVKDQSTARKKERIIKEWIEKKIISTYIRIDNNHKSCKFLKERGIL